MRIVEKLSCELDLHAHVLSWGLLLAGVVARHDDAQRALQRRVVRRRVGQRRAAARALRARRLHRQLHTRLPNKYDTMSPTILYDDLRNKGAYSG